MQEALTPTLEQVMKNTAPHLFLFTLSLLLATSIIQAIQTLLTKRARVIFPLLWISCKSSWPASQKGNS
jgi:hypothetical protein